jgi:hypothetical protein
LLWNGQPLWATDLTHTSPWEEVTLGHPRMQVIINICSRVLDHRQATHTPRIGPTGPLSTNYRPSSIKFVITSNEHCRRQLKLSIECIRHKDEIGF